jgi:hypothetical protein
MKLLSYDIIYRIYFYIDHYPTLNNFWLLDKNFTRCYMNTSVSFRHKFSILRAQLFDFLLLLPLTDFLDARQLDENIWFYRKVMCSNYHSVLENQIYGNDILFIYNMYKPFLVISIALTPFPSVKFNNNKISFLY